MGLDKISWTAELFGASGMFANVGRPVFSIVSTSSGSFEDPASTFNCRDNARYTSSEKAALFA
jgi:hypothetical protein